MRSTWACHVCTLENTDRHKRCDACKARRAVESSQSQSQSSSVRSWLQRRRKRKRPQQGTVRVTIRLTGNEEWEPLEALLPPRQAAADASSRKDRETVSEKSDRDETTQSTMVKTTCLDSLPDVSADRHLSTTDARGKESANDLDMQDMGRDCHGENPRVDPNTSPLLLSLGTESMSMETSPYLEERRDNDGMDQCVANSPGLEHEKDFVNPNVSQNHASDTGAHNAQISHEPSCKPNSSVAVSASHHNDIRSSPAYYHDNQDDEIVDASSQDCSDDIGFSQLMSQQQSGFLYTQMTQSEPDVNSFPDPTAASSIGGRNPYQRIPKRQRFAVIETVSTTTHGQMRERGESYCHQENMRTEVPSSDEPSTGCLINKANGPLHSKLLEPSLPMFERAGTGSRIQVSEESLRKADQLLNKEEKLSHFSQSIAAFQTAGMGAVISVTEESMSRATALLQDASAAAGEVDTFASPRGDLSSTSTSCPQPGAMFQTAEKGSVGSLSENSMARSTAVLQNPSAAAVIDADRKESSQAISSVSTRAPQFVAMFHTAGKKAAVSVTEDRMMWANALLQNATTTNVEHAPQICSSPATIGPQSAAMFQTAGKGSVISVKEESMARAGALLKDTALANGEVDRFASSRDLSSAPRSLPKPGAMFQTAGKGSVVSVSEDSMARATALLQKASPSVVDTARKASSQAVSSVPTRAPQFASMFHTAGKEVVVSVTETEDDMVRAKALLRNVERVPQIFSAPAVSGPQSSAMFQTAGKRSVISVKEESMARATALLRDTAVANGELDRCAPSRNLSTTPRSLPQPGAMFQTAGKGNVMSLSDDSMARATVLLQDSPVAIDEARTEESSQAVSSISTSVPRSAAMFHTAGKNVPSVTEDGMMRANALLQNSVATDVKQASQIYLSPTGSCPQLIAIFQTAGKGSVVSVKEESMEWATALLQDKSAGNARVDPKKPPRDLSSTSESCPGQSVAFQTAGKGSMISNSEDSLERTKVRLQDLSPADTTTDRIESSQDVSSTTTSVSQPVALFETAGKGTVVSVAEDSIIKAKALLHDAAATDVDEHAQSSAATSYTELVAMFQTARKGSVISITEECVPRGPILLQDTPASNFEADLKGPPRELSSAQMICSGSGTIFQTAGQGNVISASKESLAQASKWLQDAMVTNEAETATRPYQQGDVESSSSFIPVKKRARFDVFEAYSEKAVSIGAEDAMLKCKTRIAMSSHDYTQDTDEGLITQPIQPETPVLPYRRDQLESLQDEEASLAIRSVTFGLTPQSQAAGGDEVPRRQHALDTSSKKTFEPPDRVHPAAHANLPNQTTPASRLVVNDHMKRYASLSQPSLAHPAFTPKQTPAANVSAAVTMSVDTKNPYLRRRHNNPNSSTDLKDVYSPVPIDFRHIEGSFRGEVISPSSISYAESVLAQRPGESGNEIQKVPLTAHSGGPTPLGSRAKKKVVSWSKHSVKPHQLPTRTTLSNFATEYGKMNDCVSDGLDAGVHAVTLAIDSNNASRVRFDAGNGLPCSFFGQSCPPGCKIVGSVKDLRASLLSRGCEEKKLVDKWISNHCRWIVWKLASMERRFASSLAQSYMTYDHVITQLQKRYDKELKGGERSALRKVLNRDVAANFMMILCVSHTLRPIKGQGRDTKSPKHDECAVELTDGWYSIRGVLDTSLGALVRKGKIKVGTKLLICNGKLEGSEDGVDPLDPSYSCSGQNCSVALCLSANGTRLANWDAKMGFVKPCRYTRWTRGLLLVRSISHIIPGGGNVPLIDLIVCRLYPRMFLERKGTSNPSEMLERPGRKSPVISETQEYKNRMDFEKKRQQAIERLSETVQNECAKEVDEMAPELWKRLIRSTSPCDFYEQLSRCDQVVVDKWTEKRDTLLRDMAQKEIEARLDSDTAMFRESTPFIRVFVKSYNPINTEKGTDNENVCEGALLTIWNPSEQQLSLLREGHVLRIRNMSVRATKHEGIMQLTAGAKTQMESVLSSPLPLNMLASMGFSSRVFAKLFRVHAIAKKLSANLLPSSPAPEVDTAGILLRASQEGSTEERELIYMTDESGLVLRVERDRTSDHDDSFISMSPSARQNIECPTMVAFRDVRITHFDSAENCAVAVYTQTSSVATKTPRFSALLNWAESPSSHCLLRRLAACMDAGIPLNQPASNQTASATGYIAGFNIPEGSNHSHLEIKVDCGLSELQVWDFPFFLLDEALSLCSVAREPVSLEHEQDEKYAKLKVLGKIFSARGLLLFFSLRRKSNMACEEGMYEVRKLKAVDSNALADVYISTVKDAEEERKRRLEKQK